MSEGGINRVENDRDHQITQPLRAIQVPEEFEIGPTPEPEPQPSAPKPRVEIQIPQLRYARRLEVRNMTWALVLIVLVACIASAIVLQRVMGLGPDVGLAGIVLGLVAGTFIIISERDYVDRKLIATLQTAQDGQTFRKEMRRLPSSKPTGAPDVRVLASAQLSGQLVQLQRRASTGEVQYYWRFVGATHECWLEAWDPDATQLRVYAELLARRWEGETEVGYALWQ